MNNTKTLMTLLLAMLAVNTAVGHDFEDGGIYYNIIHANEVEVTYMGDSYTSEDKAYSGTVTIPETVTHDGVTYTVTTIGVYAFYECTELTSVEIPATVTAIRGAAFMLCSNLTDIVFPDSLYCIEDGVFTGTAWFENLPEGLNYIGKVAYKFKGTMPQDTCVVLEEGTLGIAALAFNNCGGMTDIVIPNTVTYIGMGTFRNCSGLTEIEIPNSVTTIGYQAFVNTPWLNNQPDGLVYAGKVAYLYKGTMPDNTSIVLDEDTRGIATDAFRKCTGLTSVVIPDAVVNIGDGAFLQCSNLKSLSIGKSVDFIGEAAFNHCSSALESITVASDNPYFDSRNDCNAIIETRSNKLVVGCRNTVIPDNIVRIGLQAFYYCSALMSVELPNTLTVIEDMAFTGCSGLTSLVIPNSVTDIRYYAFSRCSGLTSVVIPDAVVKLGAGAFGGCSSLTSLEIPKYLTDIKTYTFSGLSITSIEIPDSVVTIGMSAFAGCKQLTSATIGKSVVSIGDRGFAGCNALTTITCHAVKPPVIEGDFCFEYECIANATVFVPAEAVEDYRNAPIWKRFTNIQPIALDDLPGDVNGDHEVNIADLTALIDVILGGSTIQNVDVNNDGDVDIADVVALIDIILGINVEPVPGHE